jgi:[ribosomal protein S5]-alanine N-acetyltransferase
MVPSLTTARLILRPLELADAEQTQLLFPHWEIVRHLSNAVPWPYPQDGAYTFLHDVALPEMQRDEGWYWTLRLKSNPAQLIGCISLHKSDTINRGFWIGIPWQKQGYMSEAAEAVTDYWFNVLGFSLLRVPKAKENEFSRRISQKQGMRVTAVKNSDYVSGRLPTEIWEITADEWRHHRRAQGCSQDE